MLDIAKQTLDFYTKYLKSPTIDDIKIEDKSLLDTQWCIFVTIYKNGEVRWSAGNIKELGENIVLEIIENTVQAISKDSRFSPIKLDEVAKLKIRIDMIKSRTILKDKEILSIDHIKNGVLAIKNDYNTMGIVLPNITPLLLTWEDFIPVLKEKMKIKDFQEKDFILYSIETDMINNF